MLSVLLPKLGHKNSHVQTSSLKSLVGVLKINANEGIEKMFRFIISPSLCLWVRHQIRATMLVLKISIVKFKVTSTTTILCTVTVGTHFNFLNENALTIQVSNLAKQGFYMVGISVFQPLDVPPTNSINVLN